MFQGSIENRLKLTEILLAPGGEKLSPEAAQICAVLLMPDPRVETPTEYEIEQFLRQYNNPRGMPEGWIRNYLSKSKPQLAIDVIRAFDAHYQFERNRWKHQLLTIAFSGVVSLVVAVVTAWLGKIL